MITITDAQKGHDKLVQFLKTYEHLYGTDKVTPNMHFHTHLVDCIKDYGPVYAFWLFSFERYNGILGKYRTNNRAVELQFMKSYLHDIAVNALSNSDKHNAEDLTELQKVLNPNNGLGTLGDMEIQHNDTVLTIIKSTNIPPFLVSSNIWTINNIYTMAGTKTEVFFDPDQTSYLALSYKVMYKQTFHNISIGVNKISQLHFGNVMYGSKDSRSRRSSYILAAWCN